jgi:CPA2 family monovalent cation:H+ antiporter-2
VGSPPRSSSGSRPSGSGFRPIVGYLIAGIAVGPFTPGFVAHAEIAAQLAEVGVILLMFGVGLHFRLDELLDVRSIALPGAMLQIAATRPRARWVAHWFGWSLAAGIVFGLAVAVASTAASILSITCSRLLFRAVPGVVRRFPRLRRFASGAPLRSG